MNIKGVSMSVFLNAMLDIIPTWKTLDVIMEELLNRYDYKTDEQGRDLRKMFEFFNKEYEAHITDGYYIAHGTKGYKLTKDPTDIKKSIKDNHKRAITMLAREARVKRAMNENLHYQDIAKEIDEQIKKLDAENTESVTKK